MDLSVKIEQTKQSKLPSSHHEFFAKLYGSLEDKSEGQSSSDLNDSKDKDSSSNDEDSKVSSPLSETISQEKQMQGLLPNLKQGTLRMQKTSRWKPLILATFDTWLN